MSIWANYYNGGLIMQQFKLHDIVELDLSTRIVEKVSNGAVGTITKIKNDGYRPIYGVKFDEPIVLSSFFTNQTKDGLYAEFVEGWLRPAAFYTKEDDIDLSGII